MFINFNLISILYLLLFKINIYKKFVVCIYLKFQNQIILNLYTLKLNIKITK